GFFGSGLILGVFVDVANDILYVADFGSSAIYSLDGASGLKGSVAATRTISGSNTELSSVAARMIRIDNADRMYVSTRGGVYVFNGAKTANGNIAPDRQIQTNDFPFFDSFGLFLDTANDRAFVVNGSGQKLDLITGLSTANGSIAATSSAGTSGVVPPTGLAVDLN